MIRRLGLILTLLIVPPLRALQSGTVLNLSHDLVPLGIASQNLIPNSPILDARPLFQAAIQYASSHSIQLITVDPGAYYFLTPQLSDRYLLISNLANLTIDLQGSDLYFNQSFLIGLSLVNCSHVTLMNFTVDFLQLPFTQVRVTSVDAANRAIQFSIPPGWQSPEPFNPVPISSSGGGITFFAFRNGKLVPGTYRFQASHPIAANSLTVMNDGALWTKAPVIGLILPGDTLVIEPRSGPSPIQTQGGTDLTLSQVAVYSSGGIGINFTSTNNAILDRVLVIPRPGTDRLVSTNADGITLQQPGFNNTIRSSRVRGTLDDGMSPHYLALGFVASQQDSRHLTITRQFRNQFANGTLVSFIDLATANTIPGAHIVSQNPDPSTQPVLGGSVDLTFDQDVPVLNPGVPMIDANTADQGKGLTIQNSLVEDGVFARGITLWGLANASVLNNVIRRIRLAGVVGIQNLATAAQWIDGPIQGLQVIGNAIDQVNINPDYGIEESYGGVQLQSVDQNFHLLSNQTNQNISVVNNFISNTSRSGVWLRSVTNGAVQGNLLGSVATMPNDGSGNYSSSVLPDLAMPVFVGSSSGVGVSNNTVDSQTASVAVVSAASYSDEAIAPDSLATLFGTGLATGTGQAASLPLPAQILGTSITITDSAGVARQAPLVYVSPNQINFQLPHDCAAGAARFEVKGTTGTSGRGVALIDLLTPALFSANGNGSGAAAGQVVRTHADNTQAIEPLNQPIDLSSPTDRVTLVLYGTGIRNYPPGSLVWVSAGSTRLTPQFAGAQGAFAGLDQLNVDLPSGLAGSGTLDIRLHLGVLSSNAVQIQVK